MKVAKQAVAYYCLRTGKDWSEFFNKLDKAIATPMVVAETAEDDEIWLIKKLVEVIEKRMTITELKANKDEVKSEFDLDGRKQAGEFFTPLVWCKEARGYFNKYIPNWKDYTVWDMACGTGNLMLEQAKEVDKLFLSTLQDTDVQSVGAMDEYKNATVFQLDFLDGLDYDIMNTDFLDKLPYDLKDAIINDKPLILYSNPPYKSGVAKVTEVGRYMCSIGLNKSAYDLFYQFCWRMMHFVELFNLRNTYCCFFGPLTFFSGSNAQVLFKEFQKCFSFVDGMCISAQDFSGTSQSIEWGIGCSLWKARGGYVNDAKPDQVLLTKKMLAPDGSVVTGEKTLYAAPRQRMDEWLQPKDVFSYIEAPLATSALTFRGSEEGVLVAPQTGKIAVGALGTLMLDSTLARGNSYSAILSVPTSINFVNITKENFWRCVASFAYRNIVNAGWADTRKWLSAPDETVDGYDTWVKNCLPIFLFELKSMQSGIRGVKWQGETIDVTNKLFPVSEAEVREYCHDEDILKDLDKYGLHNDFILECIEESKSVWLPEVADLFNWCKQYILNSYDKRKDLGYAGRTKSCDAGLAQLRSGIFTTEDNQELFKKLGVARNALNKDLGRFGFLSEVDSNN